MQPDLWLLYELMLKSRLFEEAVARLWREGLISGEMHLGVGEEAIVAAVVSQLRDGDAMALDHRGTPPLLMRGVDPVLLLREFLGRPDGLCSGMGGHMHLFSPAHLAASSGIVGASGPAAAGFGLAAQYGQTDNLAVAFFGEGAVNQGMMMEAMNLTVAWKLPVLFVCKDNEWAITTLSSSVTGKSLIERAKGFGLNTVEADGNDVEAAWQAVHTTMKQVRNGDGPAYVHAHCARLEGHFLGDPLLRTVRDPVREMGKMTVPLLRSLFKQKGSSVRKRVESLKAITSAIRDAKEHLSAHDDPLERARQKLAADGPRLQELEEKIRLEIESIVEVGLMAPEAGKEKER